MSSRAIDIECLSDTVWPTHRTEARSDPQPQDPRALSVNHRGSVLLVLYVELVIRKPSSVLSIAYLNDVSTFWKEEQEK